MDENSVGTREAEFSEPCNLSKVKENKGSIRTTKIGEEGNKETGMDWRLKLESRDR